FSAGVGLHDYVGLVNLAGLTKKVVEFPDSESSIGGDLGTPKPWSPDGRELASCRTSMITRISECSTSERAGYDGPSRASGTKPGPSGPLMGKRSRSWRTGTETSSSRP